MKKVKWMFNRLRAMNIMEMVWRVWMKCLQKSEHKLYSLNRSVCDIPLTKELSRLHIDIGKLSVNWENEEWVPFTDLDIFGVFPYEDYKNKWHAGFQTKNCWPKDDYSPGINISQRIDIGDIRTNWEINRHFQFAALAKNYYCTKEQKYLNELMELFVDWNEQNRFLHGVEWTSMMELAIRVNSWVYMYAFLQKANVDETFLRKIECGIMVMTNYIMRHRAKYSSANNHLIVEMYAVALVGILTGYDPWRDKAIKILTDEMSIQNYSDGVNKEVSLHYQSFVMEAYGLLGIVMTKNGINIPTIWMDYLNSMAEFLADSTDEFETTIEFGDSDEGKILDLQGKITNHYQYVMNLVGFLVGKKYTDSVWNENLKWIIPTYMQQGEIMYKPPIVASRQEGGYTFLRSNDRRILIGIDHAELGFGSIAAHGHADALSFQMHIDGQPIFVDSGTFNYHITPESRNRFRSTSAHNTVVVEEKEQSEVLGPFIWGKKAKSKLLSIDSFEEGVRMSTVCKGLMGEHNRVFEFNQEDKLCIIDTIDNNGKMYLHIAPTVDYALEEKEIRLTCNKHIVYVEHDGDDIEVIKQPYSVAYNKKELTTCFVISFRKKLHTTITIAREEGSDD